MRCLRLFLASSFFVLLLAALNNMVFRYRNRTIIGANLANAGDEEVSEEEEEDGRIPKVLIVTRTRSGSTFLGEMLSLNPGSAFVFEPLGDPLILNLTREGVVDRAKLLEKILGCSKDVLRSVQWVPKRRFDVDKLDCSSSGNQQGALVVKTVRAAQSEVLSVTRRLRGVRVVHLVRDPRARLLSMREAFHGSSENDYFEDVSTECGEQLEEMDALEKELGKERYRLVRYEDLVTHPYRVVRGTYEFLGLPWAEEIGGIVYERTHCNLTTLLSKYRPALPFSPNGKAAADLFLSPSFGEGDRRRFGPLPRKAFPGFERYTTCRDEVAEAAGRWREELDAWSRKRMESDAHGRCAELIRKLNQT